MNTRRLLLLATLVAFHVAACGDDDVVSRDAGPGTDMGLPPPPPDMGPPPPPPDMGPPEDMGSPDEDTGPADMGPPEPCERPGVSEDLSCGMCGSRSRFCTSARVWEYGPCEGERGVCMAGTLGDMPCGRCGTAPARCTDRCVWEVSGACDGERGDCDPGTSERTATGCPAGATRGRACTSSCEWGPYNECVARPADFDADGSPYGTDCDDSDPDIRPGTSAPCGSFVCGTVTTPFVMPDVRSGERTCIGPGWADCRRPEGCPEPSGTTVCIDAPFASESRPCGEVSCPRTGGFEYRSCIETVPGDPRSSMWTPWGGCALSPPDPMSCSFDPDLIAEISCGACAEGVRYSLCDGETCRLSTTRCVGRGCTPGSRVLVSEGCPDGQVRYRDCGSDCALGTPGPCMERSTTGLDVMVLIDVTGSFGDGVASTKRVLIERFVRELLASAADVHVGLSFFSDYPLFHYGAPPDVPFQGIVEPTAEIGAIQDGLETVVTLGGGDGGEALVEALAILAGRAPHDTAVPFTSCSPGRIEGGCFRSGTRRVVVVVSEAPHHGLPFEGTNPFGGPVIDGILDPYLPEVGAPSWDETRDALGANDIALFGVVPQAPPEMGVQLELMITQQGGTVDAQVATYPFYPGDDELVGGAFEESARLVLAYAAASGL